MIIGSEGHMTPERLSSVSWLQVPAINIGPAVRVVGTSYHQDELEVIAGGRDFAGTRRRLLTVTLIREPDNPYDENAVRVDAAGVPVGHLSRDDAPRFHAITDRLANAATCRAELVGGWDQGSGDRGTIGMEIRTGRRPSRWTGRVAFLPDSPWHEDIVVAVDAASSGMPARSVVTLRNTSDGVAVLRGDAFIGGVFNRADLADLVHQVEEAGLPATAIARLATKGKLLVRVADPEAVADGLRRLGPGVLRDIRARTAPTGRWLCKRCGSIWNDPRRPPRRWYNLDFADGPSNSPHICPQCGTYRFTLPM